jgi:deoxyribodipyrimidine photolyase
VLKIIELDPSFFFCPMRLSKKIFLATASASLFRSCHIITTASAMSLLPKTRVELFFQSPQDLRDRIHFLKSKGVNAFNLVNKHRSDPVLEWVDIIRQECADDADADFDICAHYSLKYNKVPRKGVEQHAELLQNFLEQSKASEILLVSGSGGKSNVWNTVQALQYIPKDYCGKVAVAYNPYFPDPRDQAIENQRLEEKLATGKVTKVYLQFGSDLLKLKEALEYLQQVVVSCSEDQNHVQLAGSLFLPTAKLIAQQKFRPWNGVFLSPEFLEGSESASAIVLQMMKLYAAHGVELLWEAPGIRTEKDWNVVEMLMDQFHSLSTGEELLGDVSSMKDTEKSALCENKSSKQQSQNKRRKVDVEGKSDEPAILLFGSHDVRLRDNRAVEEALRNHKVVIPVFLWTKQGEWGVRGALEVVLKDALTSLDISLQRHNFRLIFKDCPDSDGIEHLKRIVQETGAKAVYWNKEHTTESRALENNRKQALEKMEIQVHQLQSSLLYDPENISLSKGFHGGHWGTLMPFLKNCKKNHGEPARPTPGHETFRLLEDAQAPSMWPTSESISDLSMAVIKGKDKWDEPIRNRFPMSEDAAQVCLDAFFGKGLGLYEQERSRADKEYATSKLSAHLRIGTISPNDLYWRTEDCQYGYDKVKTFSRRLFWRELAYYQLSCFPNMRTMSIREHYQQTKWVTGEEEKRRFEAWKWGKTGYPIVGKF